MDTQFDYFLLIAEEKNISRAARRAFISQQSLSKYLRQLEEKVGAQLFFRKPVFRLTPAGEIVLQRARQIKAISQSMEQELEEVSQSSEGLIRFGSSIGRALQLIPIVFPPLRERYPNVRLQTSFGMTNDLSRWTINGNLDLFLGISFSETPILKTIPLAQEEIFIAISDNLLLRCFPDEFPECKFRFSKGVDLREFVHVPFMMNPQISSMNVAIEQYCQRNGVSFREVATMNSNAMQIALAVKDCAACFFPQFLSSFVTLLNGTNSSLKQLNVFPVKDFGYRNQISLSYRSDAHLPKYMRFFIHQIQNVFLEYPVGSFVGVETNTFLDERKG
ncbi:hypothetical protein CE91St46_08360 [Eubacteriales bacterium]|nr:hypothetical protein CE91St46_08360 [Eubacteriales bacterium]